MSEIGITTKMLRYTRAIARWIKAGRPARLREDVAQIYYENCVPCSEMDGKTGQCRVCGCHIGLKTSPLLNKIAMATEHCPLDKW